jgi:hypothetical protein
MDSLARVFSLSNFFNVATSQLAGSERTAAAACAQSTVSLRETTRVPRALRWLA